MKNICIIFLFLTFSSCNKDEKKVVIKDFGKSTVLCLEPYNHHPYSMMNIWIKGYVNDTILIKLETLENRPILRLSGEINERWYTDYYGEGKRRIIFDPYKASNGTIEIKAKL